MAEFAYDRQMPDLTTLVASSIMAKHDDDTVTVFMPCEGIENIDGVSLDLTAAAARVFAAVLLNAADEVDP